MVRAKFRVLEIRSTLTTKIFELKPVIAKNKDWPQGSEENARFWKASPSGTLTLRYRAASDPPFDLGLYFLVDMKPDPGGGWILNSIQEIPGSLTVVLEKRWSHDQPLQHAKLELQIENEEAWSEFQGRVGESWSVVLTRSDPKSGQHRGCPCTDV